MFSGERWGWFPIAHRVIYTEMRKYRLYETRFRYITVNAESCYIAEGRYIFRDADERVILSLDLKKYFGLLVVSVAEDEEAT